MSLVAVRGIIDGRSFSELIFVAKYSSGKNLKGCCRSSSGFVVDMFCYKRNSDIQTWRLCELVLPMLCDDFCFFRTRGALRSLSVYLSTWAELFQCFLRVLFLPRLEIVINLKTQQCSGRKTGSGSSRLLSTHNKLMRFHRNNDVTYPPDEPEIGANTANIIKSFHFLSYRISLAARKIRFVKMKSIVAVPKSLWKWKVALQKIHEEAKLPID